MTHHTFRARTIAVALVSLLLTVQLPVSAQLPGIDLSLATVTITSPASGASVKGTITVSASVSGVGGLVVSGVQFKLDGANLGAEDTSSPYSIPWNTTQTSNGPHTLTAVLRSLTSTKSSDPVTVTVDNVPPTVTINQAAGQTDPTSASSINFTAAFSEPVSGFAAADVVISGTAGGTRTIAVTGGPSTFNVAISGMTEGTIIATVAAGAAQDAAGNSSIASTSVDNTVTVDRTPPSVTINQAASQTDPTNASSISFTVAFSEPVTGFAAADVGLSGTAGGTKIVAVSGGPSVFNVAVTGMTDGSITAAIAAGAAQDAAGNGSLASTSIDNTVTRDATPPAVTINQAAGQPDPTTGSTVAFTVIFSEPVLDFTAGDVTIGGTASGSKTVELTGGASTFNVTVSGASNGSVIATIAAATAHDAAGNANTASTSTDNEVVVDTTPPAIPSVPDLVDASDSGTSNADNLTNNSTLTFTGTAENGSAVKIWSNGIAIGSSVAANGAYTISTTILSDGAHAITATATDDAGNMSPPSAPLTVTIDTAPPSVGITAPVHNATISGSVAVTAGAADGNGAPAVQFTLNGADLGTEIAGAPYSMTWDTTAFANGPHRLTAVARDAAGNIATSTSIDVTVANNANTVGRIEDTDSAITFTPSGTWLLGYSGGFNWSGGTAALGFVAAQRATFTFTGTGISWIGFRGPQAGIATVYLDGTLAATVDAYAPAAAVQAVLFTANGLAAGQHTIVIEVTRTKNDASSDYYVVVDAFDVTSSGAGPSPDTTPPTVTITAPTHQSSVSGTISITAAASDNTRVAGVRFLVDGVDLSDDTAAPFAATWNTAVSGDGTHTLTAVARDDAGNTTTSAAVTVTVSNTTGSPASTATRFENHDPSIVYTDGVPAAGRPDRWWHGSRSRGWSGDISSFNRSAGAKASFRFTGTTVRWIGFRAYWAGIARVSIDGGPPTELDLFLPPCTPEQRTQGCRDEEPQNVVFTATGLTANAEHTITIESTGRKRGGDDCTPLPGPDCSADYAVVVDAIDVGPAVVARTIGARFDDADPTVGYAGSWRQDTDPGRAWNGGTAAVSDAAGSLATFTFTGTSVNWVGTRGPGSGIARIFLDGALEQVVDTYSPISFNGVVFTATNLAVGSHTLRVEVTGTRNPNATANFIYVDAFDVRTRFEDTDPAFTFSTTGGATWALENADKSWSGASASTGTGTAARASTAGARAEVTFTGTSVSWISYRGPLAGIADVYLDSVFMRRVDLYSATEEVQAVVFSAAALANAQHTLRIEVVGEKNPSAIASIVIVDAIDVGLSPPQLSVTRFQDNDPAATYTAGWVGGSRFEFWSGERASLSDTAGAQVSFTFSGTAVRWIGERRRTGGIARVSLDGVFVAAVDTFSSLQDEFQAAMFSRTGLAAGQHTLTIEVTGQKRGGDSCTGGPSATCSAGTVIVVDAFDVQ